MVIFTSIDPREFVPFMGMGGLRYTKEMKVFNLCSFDIYAPKINRLMPSIPEISELAYQNHESALFEREYFQYLDSNEAAFLDMMKFLVPEFYNANILTLIEILPAGMKGRFFCDSVVESLIKYLYLVYGIQPQVIQDAKDIFNLNPAFGVFSPDGLMKMDQAIPVLSATCPELLE